MKPSDLCERISYFLFPEIFAITRAERRLLAVKQVQEARTRTPELQDLKLKKDPHQPKSILKNLLLQLPLEEIQ